MKCWHAVGGRRLGGAEAVRPRLIGSPLCVASGAEAILEKTQQSIIELGEEAIKQATFAAGGRATIWQLTISFVCGGLVVATIFAAVTLAYALGATNVAKLKAELKNAWRRTWDMARAFLSAASMAMLRKRLPGAPCAPLVDACLVDDDGEPIQPSRMREAWMILRTGLRSTVRTASEGVEALKQQKQLYSAVVGLPGLVTTQHIVDKLLPLRLENQLEKAFTDSIKSIKFGARHFELRSFSVGSRSPQLLAARVFDLDAETIGFDVDVAWQSELMVQLEAVPDAETPLSSAIGATPSLGINKVPVTVRNLQAVGPVRVLITDLIPEPPGYGAILLSLPAPPEISLEVVVAGADVTKVCARLAARLAAAAVCVPLGRALPEPPRALSPEHHMQRPPRSLLAPCSQSTIQHAHCCTACTTRASGSVFSGRARESLTGDDRGAVCVAATHGCPCRPARHSRRTAALGQSARGAQARRSAAER